MPLSTETRKAGTATEKMPLSTETRKAGTATEKMPKTPMACDGCRKRKLRCDGTAPCARCQRKCLECTFTRELKPRKTPVRSAHLIAELENRLHALEATVAESKLVPKTILPSLDGDTVADAFSPPLQDPRTFSELQQQQQQTDPKTSPSWPNVLAIAPRPEVSSLLQSLLQTSHLGTTDVDTLSVSSPDAVTLSVSEERTLLDDYFRYFNCACPLFNRAVLTEAYNNGLHLPSAANASCRAAINMIFAMAFRLRSESRIGRSDEDEKSLHYLQKALRVVPELTQSGHLCLIGIQALLAVVIMLQGTPDPLPGSMVLASAIKIIMRLRLHRYNVERIETHAQREDGVRVFWIAYMLDKDYSLLLLQPPMLSDDEIDIDLPSERPDDGLGCITSIKGTTTINYFLIRTKLAIICSSVYGMIHSLRASKQTAESRFRAAYHLDCALDDWKRQIPLEFQPEHMVQHVFQPSLVGLVILHFFAFNCLTHIHGLATHHAHSYTEHTIGQDANLQSRQASQALCLPAAREVLHIADLVPHGHYACIWLLLPFMVSATTIVLGNAVHDPADALEHDDYRLAQPVMVLLDALAKHNPTPEVESMRRTCRELVDAAHSLLVDDRSRYASLEWAEPLPEFDIFT